MARAEGRYVVIGNIAADQTIPFNPAWLVHLNQRMLGVGGYQAWALRPGLELLERTRDRYPYRAILSHRYPRPHSVRLLLDAMIVAFFSYRVAMTS